METHLGWCRNVPTVSLAGIGGVGGAGFHISRVMGCGLCRGGESLYVCNGLDSPMGEMESRGDN